MRVCVFCGSTGLTKEHVFPNWMSKMLDSRLTATTTIEKKGQADKIYTGAILQHQAKVVCANCNNGWMSNLETAVKPILSKMLFDLNHSTTLGKDEQKLLAFWAQKTTMILNVSTGADYSIPAEACADLYHKQEPIEQITVRIGWRLPKKGKYGPHLSYFTIGEVDGPERNAISAVVGDFEVWRAIIAIGNVVFHLNGFTNNIKVEMGNVDERVTPQIFPYKSDLAWPLEWPVDALTSGGLDEFSAI